MRKTNISFVGNRKCVYSLGTCSIEPPLQTFLGDELYLYSIGDYATNAIAIIISGFSYETNFKLPPSDTFLH